MTQLPYPQLGIPGPPYLLNLLADIQFGGGLLQLINWTIHPFAAAIQYTDINHWDMIRDVCRFLNLFSLSLQEHLRKEENR